METKPIGYQMYVNGIYWADLTKTEHFRLLHWRGLDTGTTFIPIYRKWYAGWQTSPIKL